MLGVGIVGAGWVSGEHIKAFQNNPHTEVRAICSRRENSARRKAEENNLQGCRIYTDYQEMLEQDDIDLVTICTPNHLHAKEAIQAAQAGKHMLIEKPVALHLNELREMKEAVRKARVKTAVGFVLHWNPLFITVKSLIERDMLGEIFYAECDYLHHIGDWYTGWNWIRKRSYGGSSFLAGGCHAVDALRWFVGEVVEVSAYSGRYNDDYEYDTTTVAILKFQNGGVGKVSVCFDCNMPYIFNLELFGKKGAIRNNQLYCDAMPGQTGFATIPTVPPDSGEVSHHPFQGEIDHLVECILEDRESPLNLEDGVKTHEVCIAADLASARNEPVKLPLL